MLHIYKNPDPPLKKRFITVGILLVLLLSILSLRSYPDFVENYYSTGLYPASGGFMQLLFSWIPFSLGDVLYIVIILWLAVMTITLIISLFRKKFKPLLYILLGIILRMQVLIILFYLFWAINYFRKPAAARFNLPEIEYSGADLMRVSEMLIDSAESSRIQISRADSSLDFRSVSHEAKISMSRLPGSFHPKKYSYRVKKSLLTPVISYLGTAGYFNPLTGEAQVNSAMPWFSRPFTACHELAHQGGSGPEDEANFIGFLAAISSQKPLFRYSAYYHASKEFMFEVWRTDSVGYKKLQEKISPGMLADMQKEREFWNKYQGKVNQLSSLFYDGYLKANMQPGGLKTYNEMIKLSMSYYSQQAAKATRSQPF